MADDKEPTSASAYQLIDTLIPALAVAAVYLLIFMILRKSKRRFYAPRTYLGTLREHERTPALPTGMFNWFGAFNKIPDTYALQHQSLDAYLFLRFLRICAIICFVGCLITWPILFPINATGGNNQQQLDMLSFSNVNTDEKSGRYRLFAHAFVAWIFFGFILVMVCRESIFYINLRQAFLLSPIYANRISARTVLFTSVPEPYLDEHRLRKVFGPTVKNIWITGDTTDLEELVQKRDKAFSKLESAEVKLIKLANKERVKAQSKGASRDEEAQIANTEAESGSVAARWIPQSKRPTHKLGKFGLYGQKVDSIHWAREELKTLIPEVDAAQAKYRSGDNKKIPAVFIEFRTQSDAQAAFQTLSHHQALHMAPRYIGVQPGEIVWKSLKISWWQKVVRRYAVLAFITAMIVFWAIPVAFVGSISNIKSLEEQYSWLAWLKDIPEFLMGAIQGLLPAVLLAILMSLVPIIMRLCAKLAGEPSVARVELFTQNAYFAFQVVQVFLVTTLSSGIIAALSGIINDPGSTPQLLATSLPKASNLYVSYFILQGLTIGAGVVSQVVGFVIFTLLYKFLTSTPRSMYNKWTSLSAISWGSVLPVLTNIAVIAVTYAVIAPLVLAFAAIGISLFYLAYRYNILFVTDSAIDTKGLIYPRALQQLLTGVYLGEICMIGLFAIGKSIGPVIIAVVLLVFTVLFHMSMNSALDPLLYNLPKSLEAEEESLISDVEQGEKTRTSASNGSDAAVVEAPHKKPSVISKFLAPHIYTDYATLRRLVPSHLYDADSLYTPEIEADAYYPPCVTSATPMVWLPRDGAGVSTQEIAHTSKILHATDEGAVLNEKGKIEWDHDGSSGQRPPIWESKVYY